MMIPIPKRSPLTRLLCRLGLHAGYLECRLCGKHLHDSESRDDQVVRPIPPRATTKAPPSRAA